MSDFREAINRAEDKGVCSLCDKPLVDGQPRHGPTHAHWDCHEKVMDDGKAAMLRAGVPADTIAKLDKLGF